MIQSLQSQGAKGIILECTETSLLVKKEDAEIPLFDTTVIHAVEAVNESL